MDPAFDKLNIYFIPGLGTDRAIFEHLNLPSEYYTVHFLEWISPVNTAESIQSYSLRMSEQIKEDHLILIGISFGGVIAQEIAKIRAVNKVIIISSIKSKHELPRRLKLVRHLKLYQLSPVIGKLNFEKLQFLGVGKLLKRKLYMYQKYMSVKDKLYLLWATKNMLCWDQSIAESDVVHIHGTNDQVFPGKYLQNFISIEGGTHTMILTKAKTIGNLINTILLNNDHKNDIDC
jgi:pimeloyl-ACP methyl ester carboxylesterase